MNTKKKTSARLLKRGLDGYRRLGFGVFFRDMICSGLPSITSGGPEWHSQHGFSEPG